MVSSPDLGDAVFIYLRSLSHRYAATRGRCSLFTECLTLSDHIVLEQMEVDCLQ